MQEYQVIVVGGGIGGCAAVLRGAQYHLRVAWVFGDKKTAKGSRGRYVRNIDNMIGMHEGAVKEPLLEAMGSGSPECAELVRETHVHVSTQAIIDNTVDRIREQYGEWVSRIEARATRAEVEDGWFQVETTDGPVRAPYLVLATGVADRQPRVKVALPSGKALDEIHWVYPYANHETFLYCIRCEGHLAAGTPTAVIGHSPAAAQVAMMLHERYATPVTILTNGETPDFPESSRQLLDHYGIGVREERLVGIQGERAQGRLHGVNLEAGPSVEVQWAFVVLGLHRVYNDLAVGLGCDLEPNEPTESSHVVVGFDAETSVRGCFAVGDLATHADRPIRKQVYTAQEYAVRALDRIDARIRRARRDAILAGKP